MYVISIVTVTSNSSAFSTSNCYVIGILYGEMDSTKSRGKYVIREMIIAGQANHPKGQETKRIYVCASALATAEATKNPTTRRERDYSSFLSRKPFLASHLFFIACV